MTDELLVNNKGGTTITLLCSWKLTQVSFCYWGVYSDFCWYSPPVINSQLSSFVCEVLKTLTHVQGLGSWLFYQPGKIPTPENITAHKIANCVAYLVLNDLLKIFIICTLSKNSTKNCRIARFLTKHKSDFP